MCLASRAIMGGLRRVPVYECAILQLLLHMISLGVLHAEPPHAFSPAASKRSHSRMPTCSVERGLARCGRDARFEAKVGRRARPVTRPVCSGGVRLKAIPAARTDESLGGDGRSLWRHRMDVRSVRGQERIRHGHAYLAQVIDDGAKLRQSRPRRRCPARNLQTSKECCGVSVGQQGAKEAQGCTRAAGVEHTTRRVVEALKGEAHCGGDEWAQVVDAGEDVALMVFGSS